MAVRVGEPVWVEHQNRWLRGVVERELGDSLFRVAADELSVDASQKQIHVRSEDITVRRSGELHALRTGCPAEFESAMQWRVSKLYGWMRCRSD